MVPSLGHNHVWSLNESFLRFVPTFSFAVRVVSAIILLLRKLNWLNCSRLPWRYHCDPLMVFLMFRIILQLCVWRVAVRWLHKHWGLSSSSERAWCSRRNAINAKKKEELSCVACACTCAVDMLFNKYVITVVGTRLSWMVHTTVHLVNEEHEWTVFYHTCLTTCSDMSFLIAQGHSYGASIWPAGYVVLALHAGHLLFPPQSTLGASGRCEWWILSTNMPLGH